MSRAELAWTELMLILDDRAPRLAANLKYARYLFLHKLYVYRAGSELGLGRLRLIAHDWHKLLPSEWAAYREKFYGSLDVEAAPPAVQQARLEAWDREVALAFDVAWNSHQKRARHHWQHWVLLEDDGAIKLLPIPRKYVLEMLADWRGASKAITGRDDVREWYLKTRRYRLLHPHAQQAVEIILGIPPTMQQARRLVETDAHDPEVLRDMTFSNYNRRPGRDTPGVELPPDGMYRCEECGELEYEGMEYRHRHVYAEPFSRYGLGPMGYIGEPKPPEAGESQGDSR